MIRCERFIVARGGRMVVDRLSLAVGPGESLAVVGRTGAGKSTLLAALATALPAGGGESLVCGRSLRGDPAGVRRVIGYVPAHLTTWPGVRADEFLGLSAAAAGLHGAALRDAVTRGIALAGLGDGTTPIDRLPDGRKKLLLVARALLHAPPVLLIDDPGGNLDSHERRSLEILIGDLQLAGRTVVAAIDDGCVPECFTHLAVLAEGRIVHHGPAHFAAVRPGRSWTYRIRSAGQAEAAAAVVGRLADAVDTVDADALDCTLGPTRPPLAELVAALVRAGIAVEAAGPHPPWTAQLIDLLTGG